MKARSFALALLMMMGSVAPVCAATEAVLVMPANSPVEVIKNFYAELTDVMKQGDKLGYAGRYKKLDPTLQAAFNFPLMAHFAVGPVWANASPVEQAQITKSFSEFSVATYASRFSAYDGEQFNVLGEKTTAGGKIVETTLKPKNSDAVALNYLMRQDERGAWRIVDVFMNGTISELATRRAEFASVIQHDGIAALVNSLSQKSKQMGPT